MTMDTAEMEIARLQYVIRDAADILAILRRTGRGCSCAPATNPYTAVLTDVLDRLGRMLGGADCARRAATRMIPPCVWYETGDGWYETECGHAFIVNEGTPAENHMPYCCYCGKRLKVVNQEREGCDA